MQAIFLDHLEVNKKKIANLRTLFENSITTELRKSEYKSYTL